MSEDDISFLRRRAAEEADLARRSPVPEAARVHAKLAAAYAARLAAAELLGSESYPMEDGAPPDIKDGLDVASGAASAPAPERSTEPLAAPN